MMQTALKPKQRIEYIDVLRGLGIIIMIMGHVGFGGKFDRFIHTFHMPLFFFISGYLFTKRDSFSMVSLVKKKARQLLIPYICFGIFHYIIWVLFVRTTQSFSTPLISLVSYNTKNMPIAGALWFFTALFFTEVFYSFFTYRIHNEKLLTAVIFTVSAATMVITTYTDLRLPLTIDIALAAIGFYHIGRILRSVADKNNIVTEIKNKSFRYLCFGVLLFAVTLVIAFINGYVNMKSGWYAIIPLSVVNAIIGSVAIFVFAVFIDEKIHFLKGILIFIGKNSIVYLCLNQVVILLITNLIGPTMGNMGYFTIPTFTASCINLVLSTVVLSVCVLIFNKTFLKFVIGK